jgi:hypothetical protein
MSPSRTTIPDSLNIYNGLFQSFGFWDKQKRPDLSKADKGTLEFLQRSKPSQTTARIPYSREGRSY